MKNTEFATRVIGQLSLHLANSQEMADKIFYRVPVTTTQTLTQTLGEYMQRADYIKLLMVNLGIADEVYEAAYQIYDFRNSGKDGYTLENGKIVPINEAKILQDKLDESEALRKAQDDHIRKLEAKIQGMAKNTPLVIPIHAPSDEVLGMKFCWAD